MIKEKPYKKIKLEYGYRPKKLKLSQLLNVRTHIQFFSTNFGESVAIYNVWSVGSDRYETAHQYGERNDTF